MNNSVYVAVLCLTTLLIGFFAGLTAEQHKRVQNLDHNEDLREMFVQSKSLIIFWEDGYMKRDSVLQEISNHKDCTKEIKVLIGKIY